MMGVGRVSAKFMIKDGVDKKKRKRDGPTKEIHRIWCEWLGNNKITTDRTKEIAIVIFDFTIHLYPGVIHPNLHIGEDTLLPKFRKSISFSNLEDSCVEESKSMKLGNDDQHLYSQVFSSKNMTKEFKKELGIGLGYKCCICLGMLLPNRDAATLMEESNEKLNCISDRGFFLVFHVSCLIRWILLCEVEAHRKGKKHELQEKPSTSCPHCKKNIDGSNEKLNLDERDRSMINLRDAHKAWMENPEPSLENCSTGLCFPPASDETLQEDYEQFLWLCFYRAGDWI